MADTTAERATAVQEVLTATASASAPVREAALAALVPAPDQSAADDLWKILVVGLLVLVAIALARA